MRVETTTMTQVTPSDPTQSLAVVLHSNPNYKSTSGDFDDEADSEDYKAEDKIYKKVE
jgi:hypothetical protein